MNNDALQIIVTILGIVSQLVLLIKEIPKGAATQPTPAHADTEPPKRQGYSRSLLDLSFVLLCSTFFSLILMDSLVISGRTPSPGPGTIMKVLAITAVVFAMMFCAWWLNQSELVTGFLAMIILTVLIISPGGPFGASSLAGKNAQSGLTLYVPVMILVTIAATMMIYSFGNPISNVVERRKRYLVSMTLLALLIVGAVSLGQHLVTQVMKAENTPKIESTEGKQLLREISSWQWPQRQKFYQLAAEITLSYKYQKEYLQVRGMQRQFQPGPAPAPTPESSATPPSSATSNVSPSTAPTKVLLAPSPTPKPLSVPTPESKKNPDEIFTAAGSERIDALIDRFDDLPINSQEKYLLKRLDWVHPVGQEKAQCNLPLTGIKIEDRFERIGFLRMVQILGEQPNLERNLLEEFNYPSEVVSYFKDEEGYPTQWKKSNALKLPKVIEELLPAKKESSSQLTLFPRFSVGDYDPRLRMQLSLPMEAESSIAYSEYGHLALQLVLDRITNSTDKANGKAIAEDFDKQLSDYSKNALRYYVANDPSPLEVLQSLIRLSDVAVNFDALTDGSTSATYRLKSYLETYRDSPLPAPPTDSSLKTLAHNIVTKTNKDVTNTVIRLLDRDDPNTPIAPLFRTPVFDLIKRIDKLEKDSKLEFFNAVADPVWPVVQLMAHTSASQFRDEEFFDKALNTFRNKDNSERNNLLHQLAISVYQPGGDFSLDPINLLVVEAKGWNDTAALLCAAVIVLPLLFICVLSSGYFARKLVARDRMRELISKELQGYTQSFSTVGNPVELQGREDVLRSLRSLAERGWSTIGVVGRRGVGKSRILYALSQSHVDQTETPTIRVWVASPSKFQEEDFIASVFERLAISTESAIASFLNAKPLSIRRIESRATHHTLWYYAGVICLLLIVVFQMYDRLTSADIVITWLPIAALLFSSIVLLLHYISRLQPVDLSSWLQRDRAHNPHTVLLYREVNEALRYLRRRAQQAAGNARLGGPARHLTMRISSIIFWVALFFTLYFSDGGAEVVIAGLLIVAAAGGSWVLLYRQREAFEDGTTQGQSMMSLIAEYRSFAATIVYRLKQGALGHSPNRRFSVLVCVDELDKIVDFEEIRMFVRRIKAIFEVPGVYYYVSLAEDTLKALYLGASAGKNEIDSSFDHIVRIPPVTCEIGEAIATHYLKAHAVDELPPRLARTIATLSYGIPRDIIRRCDEYIASVNGARVSSGKLVAELRKQQASLGYELRHLSSGQVNALSSNARSSAMTVQGLLGNNAADTQEPQQRLILSLWLNALIEAGIDVPDDESWRKLSEKICAVGYELADERVADLQREIESLQTIIFAGNPGRESSVQVVS